LDACFVGGDYLLCQHRRVKRIDPVTFARATYSLDLTLVMVFQISAAIAIGFVLGRIWQIRCDLEDQRDVGFTAPPIARIPRP
jgi:hypothetical protein